MGFLKMLRNLNNAEATREAMRMSYRKHFKLARRGAISADDNPHPIGLYGALASRYRLMGRNQPEVVLWAELAPFLGMPPAEGVEALAEYVVLQERPGQARLDWLKDAVRRSLWSPGPHLTLASAGLANRAPWSQWLDGATLAHVKAAAVHWGERQPGVSVTSDHKPAAR